MKVADIMTSAAVCDSPDDTLADGSALMWQQQTGSLLLMSNEEIAGIVTERDVLKTIAGGHDPKQITLREIMTPNVVTVAPETRVKDAAQIMFDKWFRHLPVVTEQGEVVGIVSLRDLLYLVAQGMEEPEHLQVLTGHKLARDKRLERIEAGDLD